MALVGRKEELGRLTKALEDAASGRGSVVLISGEPGIGKTRLVQAFMDCGEASNIRILAGAASADSTRPFLAISKAMGGEIGPALFEDQEYTRFIQIFAINHAGILVSQASSEEGDTDADIFAGMLSAVQDFVRESLGRGGGRSGLGRLEYGDMKILIEHGQHLYLTTVFRGKEHPDMLTRMRQTLLSVEKEHEQLLENWTGKMSETAPIQEKIKALAEAKFLVRKDLEGLKLENERLRVADAVLECLADKSKQGPLVLLLEDMHWADESTLFCLSYMARNIANIPVLLIATARSGENPSLDKALEMMRAEETATELNLSGLEKTDVVGILDNLYPKNDFPADFIDSVADKCGGIPLFVVELLRNMVHEQSIAEKDGTYSLVNENYSIPDTVEGVIQGRLSRLSPEAMAVAEYASCIGRDFGTAVAMSVETVADPAAGLAELRESGIVIGHNGNASFSHAMYQDAIYSAISQRWKSAHHKSIGKWFEESHAMNRDEVMYELARHFSQTGEHVKAYEYGAKAGDKASDSYAAEQAMAFYAGALGALQRSRGIQDAGPKASELHEKIGDLAVLLNDYKKAKESYSRAEGAHPDNIVLARLKRKTADILFKLGEWDDAKAHLSQAKAKIGDSPDRELGKVLISESYLHISKGELDRGIAVLTEALEIFRERGGSGSDVGTTLRAIGNVHWRRGEFDNAQRHYEMSLEAMEKAKDLQGMAAALNNLGLVHADKGEPDIAVQYYDRALGAMEKTGDKYQMTMTFNNLGLLHKDRGRLGLGLEYFQRSLELRERIGDKNGIAAALLNIGNLYYMMGKFGKGMEMCERCLRISLEIGEKKNIASATNALGFMHKELGNVDEAKGMFAQSIKLCEEIGEKYTLTHALDNLGLLMLDMDEPGKALEHFTRSLKLREEIGDQNDVAWSYYEMAQANTMLGNHALALRQAEKSAALAEEMSLGLERGASRMVMGMAYREMGDYGKAIELLEKAEKAFLDGGFVSMHPDTFYEMGKLHKVKGDLSQARDWFAKALAEYKGMSMKLMADKCLKELEALGQE
jgi:tetratricopeptide (TPR) repeat protein